MSTPLGSPVVPLVYIIVEISLFSLFTNSYCLSPPCSKQKNIKNKASAKESMKWMSKLFTTWQDFKRKLPNHLW